MHICLGRACKYLVAGLGWCRYLSAQHVGGVDVALGGAVVLAAADALQRQVAVVHIACSTAWMQWALCVSGCIVLPCVAWHEGSGVMPMVCGCA